MNSDFDIHEEQYVAGNKEKDFENALRPLHFEDFSGQRLLPTSWGWDSRLPPDLCSTSQAT